MKVEKWPFSSISNKLLISMHSEVNDENDLSSSCQGPSSSQGLDTSNNLRFMKISFNGVELYLLFIYSNIISFLCLTIKIYGKFTEVAYFDDTIKTVQYYYNSTSNDVVIVAPHFWDYVGT